MKTILFPKMFEPFFCGSLIRLGKDNDGGYIVNRDDVLNAKQLLSLGVGEDITFEKHFYEVNDCPIISYDANENTDKHSSFFVGNKHHFKKNINKDISFESIQIPERTFIKCDIDGDEYQILPNIIKKSKNIIGMAFEFHDVHEFENYNDLTNFISKIDQKIVHVHINNYTYLKTDQGIIPTVIEISFSSSNDLEYREDIHLPHILDMPNNILDDDFRIIFK